MPSALLTARFVESVKPSDRQVDYFDERVTGLGLRVSPAGTKSWVFVYRTNRRLRRWTIGRASDLTLADARERARQARNTLADGVDPAAAKRDRREAMTVGDLATDYIERYAKPRKRSWREDARILRADVLPHWKHRAVADIRRGDVRDLVDTIAERAPIAANRTLALVCKMFNVAVDKEWITSNPAARLGRPSPEQQRHRVLTDDELRRLWSAFDALSPAMAGAFRLRLLTLQRGGEVHAMKWRDVDLETRWWTVPTADSKNKLPHRVPLTHPALKILTALRAAAPDDAVYVLAGARGRRQRSEAAQTFRIPDFVGHDMRRTGASYLASAGVARLVIGKILNHVEKGVTAVYDRHSYDAEKQLALDVWAKRLTAILRKK